MPLRSTRYATEIVTAGDDGGRIERIRIRETGAEEIRFSWWKNGKFQTRPLDVTEEELLPLLEEAVTKGVFSEGLMDRLEAALKNRKR